MTSLQLHFWQETMSLEEAIRPIWELGLELPVLKEIGKRLVYLRAFGEYNIEAPSDEQVLALRESFLKRFKLDQPEALARWYEANNQSEARLSKQLSHQDQLNRLKQVVASVEVVKEAFLKRKAKLDSVLFGLIRVESEAVAQELFYRIRDDQEDFSRLATQFSKGPEAPTGGLVGPRPVSELNPELRNIILKLKPGELTEPFTLDDKLFIIAKLIRFDHAALTPQLEATIRDEVFDSWTERQLGLSEMKLVEGTASGGRPVPEEASVQ